MVSKAKLVFSMVVAQTVPVQTKEPRAVAYFNHPKHSLMSLCIPKYSKEIAPQADPLPHSQPSLLVQPWNSV